MLNTNKYGESMAYEEAEYFTRKEREGRIAMRYFTKVANTLSRLITEGQRISTRAGEYSDMVLDVVEKLRDAFRESAGNVGSIKADLEFLEELHFPSYV